MDKWRGIIKLRLRTLIVHAEKKAVGNFSFLSVRSIGELDYQRRVLLGALVLENGAQQFVAYHALVF